jgi:mannose-1-phosphate guanylyltransferase/mannose-6-phosphate isomerase
MMKIRPVILSGGSGTRLWPLSRQSFPKQLLPIIGSETMLQVTARRVSGAHFLRPILVGGEDHGCFLKSQLEEIGQEAEVIILEPVGRNTASAAALAAEWVLAQREDELLLLLPSDHAIDDTPAFERAIGAAIDQAMQGGIVTFGAKPTSPSSHYGYIELGEQVAGKEVFSIASFVEKPDEPRAAEFIASGRYLWNCGIFLFRASHFRAEMRRHMPRSAEAVAHSMVHGSDDGIFLRPQREAFRLADNLSIDYGIMEKTDEKFIRPTEMGWSDVGTWKAVWEKASKDDHGNALSGETALQDSRNCLIRNDGLALIAGLGLESMAVIAQSDAIFIAPLDRASGVKTLIDELGDVDLIKSPPRVTRPWGSSETIGDGVGFQIKLIVILPGEQLSAPMHSDRSEHWIVVRGTAQVTVDDQIRLLQENQSTFIPVGAKYQLANPGTVPLQVVEVKCGPFLGHRPQ